MKRLLLIMVLAFSLTGCGTVSKWLGDTPTADEIRAQVEQIDAEADKALVKLAKLRTVELISETEFIEATNKIEEIKAGLSLIKILLDFGRLNDANNELAQLPTL